MFRKLKRMVVDRSDCFGERYSNETLEVRIERLLLYKDGVMAKRVAAVVADKEKKDFR